MKQIFAALLFFSFGANAQITQDTTDSRLLKYDTAIVLNLSPKFELDRKATFMGFSYNIETESLSLRWRIRYYKDGEPVALFGKDYEDKIQLADQSTFVAPNGNVIDTTGYNGQFFRQFDFYKLVANRGMGGLSINQMIIAAGMLPGKWKE